MQLTMFDLRDLLNYDTNTAVIFTGWQRIVVHAAIAQMMSERPIPKFSNQLNFIIQETLEEMHRTGWNTIQVTYKEENGEIITIKN